MEGGENKMDERRKMVRWEVNQPAEIMLDEECGRGMSCTVRDISTEGMRVFLPRKVFPEALSRIRVDLADGLGFRTEASVAWSQDGEQDCCYGLRFHDLNDAYKTRIYDYVESNFPKELRKQWWTGIS